MHQRLDIEIVLFLIMFWHTLKRVIFDYTGNRGILLLRGNGPNFTWDLLPHGKSRQYLSQRTKTGHTKHGGRYEHHAVTSLRNQLNHD